MTFEDAYFKKKVLKPDSLEPFGFITSEKGYELRKTLMAVSYTHLDVYKRQIVMPSVKTGPCRIICGFTERQGNLVHVVQARLRKSG